MSFDIRLPNITGKTEAEQMVQVKSYLHQLVEQLNWALNTVNSAQEGNASAPVEYTQGKPSTAQEAEDTFNSIKALIIKSADIVKAYETTIFSDFNGKYFAESDFGTYIKETNRTVEENSKGVKDTFDITQQIKTDMEDYIEETKGYIYRGELDDGKIGIEIGEKDKDGVFHHYARFTSDKLSFYDRNDDEVAYIGAGCLYVRGNTVFLGEIQLGGYKTDTVDGLAFTWIG